MMQGPFIQLALLSMYYAFCTVVQSVHRQYWVKQGSDPDNLESNQDEKYWKKWVIPSMQ